MDLGLGLSYEIKIEDTEDSTELYIIHEEIKFFHKEFPKDSDHEIIIAVAESYIQGYEDAITATQTYVKSIENRVQNQQSNSFLTSNSDNSHIEQMPSTPSV